MELYEILFITQISTIISFLLYVAATKDIELYNARIIHKGIDYSTPASSSRYVDDAAPKKCYVYVLYNKNRTKKIYVSEQMYDSLKIDDKITISV